MGPNDPFQVPSQSEPAPAVVTSSRSPMLRTVGIGAATGALLGAWHVFLGLEATLTVLLLAFLGAMVALAVHLAGSSMVRSWLVRLLDDRT